MKEFNTVKQLAPKVPFSESGLRWAIFNAERNGLSSAIVRIGKKVLIDVEAFTNWIESHRAENQYQEKKRGQR